MLAALLEKEEKNSAVKSLCNLDILLTVFPMVS